MTLFLEGQKPDKAEEAIAEISSIYLSPSNEKGLLYRGYAIEDLAKHASFEETCWLILRGNLPKEKELTKYKMHLKGLRDFPVSLKAMIEQIPKSTPMMEVMRSSCSLLGHFEPGEKVGNLLDKADKLIASLGSMLLYWHTLYTQKKRIELLTDEDMLAGHLLHLILGRPSSQEHIKALDTSLVLCAEQAFSTSTLTVQIIASTLADFYSAICGGIGALSGFLHGGAAESVMRLIMQFQTEEEAGRGIKQLLRENMPIRGFGHRVYVSEDPRSALMKQWAYTLSRELGDEKTFAIAETIEQTMSQEKKLFPNIAFYTALVYRYVGIPLEMYTPLFALARIAGWSAHLMEQRAHNQLICPESRYSGYYSSKNWVPLKDR